MALTEEQPPPGLKKVTVDGRVIIRQNWFRSLTWGKRGSGWNVVIVPMLVIAVLITWQGPNLRQGMQPQKSEVPGLLVLGAIILLLVYYSLARLVNTTTLEFSGGVLRMDYGPLRLPWLGGPCLIPETDIARVICIEHDQGSSVSHDIAVATRNGERRLLFHRLRRFAQVSYLVREICSRLKITDSVEQR